MFGWLTQWFQDQAIAADFARVEREAQAAHVAEAQRRFATGELEQQAATRQAALDAAVEQRFGAETRALARAFCDLQQDIARHNANLDLLTRDYRAELTPLYDELNANKAQLKDLYETKDSAHEDLQEAREALESWYGKAERTNLLFGNKGRALPRHSLFGQDLSDRDGYKADRDAAYETIGECKEEIAQLKQRNQALFTRIQAIKADRQRAYDLRQAGQYANLVKDRLVALQIDLKLDAGRQRALDGQRLAYQETARMASGLRTLEERIRDLNQQRAAAIADFSSPATRALRQQAHRADWLRRNG